MTCALVLLAAAPRAARSQTGVSKEGALFLLVPVGARAVALGQAASAVDLGSESIWWNPAAVALLKSREVTVNYSKTVVAEALAIDGVYPAGRAGVFGAAFYFFNPGQQSNTDANGNVVGTIYPGSFVASATYAATFGTRVSAGVSYKYVQDKVSCSGLCNVPSSAPSTSAVDVGMRVSADTGRRLTLALDVRDLGFLLQVIDVEQADRLPTRVHLAAQYALPGFERAVAGGALRLTGELVDNLALTTPTLRLGAEFSYREQVFLRAGLADVREGIPGLATGVASGSGDGANYALGFGLQRGGFSLDFAHAFGGYSSDAGYPPTYVTLRLRF